MRASRGAIAAIRIESDGKMEKDPAMAPPKAENLDEFLTALRGSGIVGLGGAAFPLWAKLDAARRGHQDRACKRRGVRAVHHQRPPHHA